MEMTVKEIKDQIARETSCIQLLERQIDDAKAGIKYARKAIRFWQGELKKFKKGKVQHG